MLAVPISTRTSYSGICVAKNNNRMISNENQTLDTNGRWDVFHNLHCVGEAKMIIPALLVKAVTTRTE